MLVHYEISWTNISSASIVWNIIYGLFLTVLLVVSSLGAVGAFISMNILGFMSGNGAAISIVIVFDVLCLLVGIDNWLDERDRKKSGLSREEFYGHIIIR